MNTDTRTSSAVKSSIDDLRALLQEAESVLADAGEDADEKVRDLQRRMRHALNETRSTFERLRSTANERIDDYDEYVHSHPYQAVGVAAAVGAVVGILLSRKS